MKNPKKVNMGKKSRAAGKRFELRVRGDQEKDGWIVFRNSNDVVEDKFIQAKTKWNFFTKRPMGLQTGFPDFICVKRYHGRFMTKFIESKMNNLLTKEEKCKCQWIEENLEIPVFIAFKGEKRGEIIYRSWK